MTATIGLADCGAGGSRSHSHKNSGRAVVGLPVDSSAIPEPGGMTRSGGVVVRVGHASITRSQLQNRIAIELHSEPPTQRTLPIPPDFIACIASLAAQARQGTAGARPSHAQLKARCQELHDKLLNGLPGQNGLLGQLISAEWVIGEVEEEGFKLTDREVRARLEQIDAQQFGSEAKFQAFLSQSGENLPDLLFNIKLQMAHSLLFGTLKSSLAHPAPATIAQYYARHKSQFMVPEQRDLGLVRASSAAAARQARKELAAGVSFASVASKQSAHQPIFTSSGLLHGLEPHVYSEKPLNDAIFSAKPHILSGPVRLNLHPGATIKRGSVQDVDGYYVFDVIAVRPSHYKPLVQVKGAIAETLYKHALREFTNRYRAKWIARTDCHPGYVVRKCRQFKPAPGEPPEDFTIS